MTRLLAHPLPPISFSKLSLFLSLPACRRSSLLTERGWGWGSRESSILYKSFNILWGKAYNIVAESFSWLLIRLGNFWLCCYIVYFLWSHTVQKHGNYIYLHCILFGIVYSTTTHCNKDSLIIYSCEWQTESNCTCTFNLKHQLGKLYIILICDAALELQ